MSYRICEFNLFREVSLIIDLKMHKRFHLTLCLLHVLPYNFLTFCRPKYLVEVTL